MSLDITVYDDKELEISANVGSWGVRLYITDLANPKVVSISGRLILSRLDEMIYRLQKIRDQLAGDYSFDLVRGLTDYKNINFTEDPPEETDGS